MFLLLATHKKQLPKFLTPTELKARLKKLIKI